MNRRVIRSLLAVLVVLQVMPSVSPADPLLSVSVDRNATYTPGSVRLAFQLTTAARLARRYDL
ncbi:MAG: hypothetical protein EHM35_04275 [Planctomycetaceae bacterium]|nr:MAG: hypothetical protein EHM35_04275 [Planctomycetaceae bacterium]